jgi:hypothetical protein
MAQQPNGWHRPPHCCGFTSHSDTTRSAGLPDAWLTSRRDWQHNTRHARGGLRIRSPSNLTAADPRLIERGATLIGAHTHTHTVLYSNLTYNIGDKWWSVLRLSIGPSSELNPQAICIIQNWEKSREEKWLLKVGRRSCCISVSWYRKLRPTNWNIHFTQYVI